VPEHLAYLDHVALKSPAEYQMKPSETFKQNVWVQMNHEEDPRPVIDCIGVDRVLFGSDYPHVEGLADPLSYLDDIADLSADDQRKIMGGNMLGVMGIEAPATV
jgi:predicted TIM-barrel fold metal-dependent hydrolase